MNLLQLFNVDEEDYTWQDLAVCKDLNVNYFFDFYEEDPIKAAQIDEHCLTCPVMAECAEFARNHKQQGVWGGIYWTETGTVDHIRNRHKTPDVWKAIKARLEG